jgi:hypothetical protein
MAIQPATRLGPYEVLSAIGAGGMGEVYKARDTRLDRIVAIKVLPQHLADKPELRDRFEREARTIASLNHPHICTLYDVGHQDGTDFLVMEYLEGETLATRLLKGPLPLEQVLQYAIEISDALDKAHRKGVTHRDISTDVGSAPLWARSGRELFYIARPAATGINRMMAVNVTLGATFTAEKPRMLFEGQIPLTGTVRGYDVSPDGQRFLLFQLKEVPEPPITGAVLVQNWFEELKRRVPIETK